MSSGHTSHISSGGHSSIGFSHPTFVMSYVMGNEFGAHMGGMRSFAQSTVEPTALDMQGKAGTVYKGMPTIGQDAQPLVGYEVHVYPHGQASLIAKLEEIRHRLNLVNLTDIQPALDGCDTIEQQILPWDAWNPNASPVMPSGATYADPNGLTTLYKGYWQVGKKDAWRVWRAPEKDPNTRYYLEVRIITWQYQESGDYETRIDIRIVVLPEWVPQAGKWGYHMKEFEQHQKAAIDVASEVYAILKGSPVSKACKALRTYVEKTQPTTEPVPVHKDGVYDESRETMEQQDEQAVQDEYVEDMTVMEDANDIVTMPVGDGPPSPPPPPTQVIIVGEEGDWA